MTNGPEGATFDPSRDLSEHDREMLSKHAEDLGRREREARSRDNGKDDGRGREWTVEIPVVHRASRVGRPEDVKRGDKAEMTGRGSRHLSHPADNEKLPLKNR